MAQIIFQVLFWIAVVAMFHSYVLYPFILILLTIGKKLEYKDYSSTDELPFLTVMMSVYNEEVVLGQKIKSIFDSNYPKDKIEVLVGSDCSTDSTNRQLQELAAIYPNLKFFEYHERKGKIGTMNTLLDMARGEIIVSTDANVMLDKNTLFELVRYFKDERVGLVDTQMKNIRIQHDGISYPESFYIGHEVMVKHREGILWGTMIGPFGGCFAIRKALYKKPHFNTLVDDFFINMQVLRQGGKCLNNLDSVVYEDVSNLISEEFRRKVRIATGNFQNLKEFRGMLWPIYKPVAFAFLSHKVIRWFGPFFILLAIVSIPFLMHIFLYQLIAMAMGFVLLIPLFDNLLRTVGINLKLFRFVTHFFSMNIALMVGFFKYLKGVESNVWQPTQRNQ